MYEEEFEDTKGAIRIRISKNNRQHNGYNGMLFVKRLVSPNKFKVLASRKSSGSKEDIKYRLSLSITAGGDIKYRLSLSITAGGDIKYWLSLSIFLFKYCYEYCYSDSRNFEP